MRRQYTAEQRRELIDLVTTGRATLPEAVARLGVPFSTAYY
jgi:transposase-like protein